MPNQAELLRHIVRIPRDMTPEALPVATMTLARDQAAEDDLLQSLHALARGGRRTFAADGGSRQSFLDRLAALPIEASRARGPGLVGQVAASLMAAAAFGAPFIVYTEPDKQTFFETGLDAFVNAAPLGVDVGIVLAARSDAAFATFPRFQQHTERAFNDVCAQVVGESTDYLYGPFIVNASIVHLVELIDADLGWGWRPLLFALARQRGYRIASVVGDWVCPPAGRADEERVHRLRQLDENVRGLLAAASGLSANGTRRA